MSLLVLIDKEAGLVGILQRFREPAYGIDYACGPLLEMTVAEFRERGFDLTMAHFEEYERIRMTADKAKPVFERDSERAYLKRQTPLMISKNMKSGEFDVSPLCFEKYTLGGLVSHRREHCSILRPGFSRDEFWAVFDRAFEKAG